MFPKALNLYHGVSGAKSGDSSCFYAFLLIHLCQNVTVYNYVSADSSDGFAEKINKKFNFLLRR
jgi:hypothetical protein